MGNSNQPTTVDAKFYAVVVPKWSDWRTDQEERPLLMGASVQRVTQKRPESNIPAGAIVTRLTLRIAAGALLPLQPSAVIEIGPAETEVLVSATNPEDQ